MDRRKKLLPPPSTPRKKSRTRSPSPPPVRRIDTYDTEESEDEHEHMNLETPSNASLRDQYMPPPPILIVEDESRIQRYERTKTWIKSVDPDEICNLGRAFRNPVRFSEGAVGFAYAIPSLGISAKIVKREENTIREIEWYKHFTSHVLKKGGPPFFPLIHHVQRCENGCNINKTYNGRNWFVEPVTRGDSEVIFSELAHGNLKDIIERLTDNELLNMFYQVFLGCRELEQQGIIHNDLSPANILYFNDSFPIHPPRYDSFSISDNKDKDEEAILNNKDDKKVRIQNQGRMWILWDFGMMVRNGQPDPRKEVTMKSTLFNDLQHGFFPILRRHYYLNVRRPFFNRLDSIVQQSNSVEELICKVASSGFEGISLEP